MPGSEAKEVVQSQTEVTLRLLLKPLYILPINCQKFRFFSARLMTRTTAVMVSPFWRRDEKHGVLLICLQMCLGVRYGLWSIASLL